MMTDKTGGLTLTYIASLLLLAAGQQAPQQKPPAETTGSVRERVTVERVVITGRVIDRFARPIPGLTASDFRLRVDGKEAPIESIEWNPSPSPRNGAPTAAAPAEASERPAPRRAELPGPATPTTPSRTVVMLFQWEIAGQKDTGFMRMMRQAEKMVDAFGPDDRIAVLGFGASLRLLQDLTTDHAALHHAIEEVRGWRYQGPPADPTGPTLAAAIAGCGKRNSIQKAIVCIGTSLQALHGPKTLLFFGWTIGRPQRASWFVDYPAMVEAITRAQTSVFVLDVSDYRHSLDSGLKLIAADTGGLFNGGCIYDMIYCADLARLKTQTAVEGGSYDLVFRDPAVARGWHEVDVELVGRAGIAVFHRWYRN